MRHLTQEHRDKISKGLKGEKHFMFGKHHFKETCQKISKSMQGENHPMFGRRHSEGTKKKMSNTWQQKTSKPDYIHNWKGKRHTKRAKIKMAIAQQKYRRKNSDALRNINPSYFTNIEQIVREFLEKYNVDYKHNMRIDFYFPDFIIFENVIIECDGNYWHRNDNSECQLKRDNFFKKKKYLIFHLTEDEIVNNLKASMITILKEVRANYA